MNKLYYSILPDNMLVAYAAKGNADGEPGFLRPVLNALEKDMNANKGEGNGFAEQVWVASVLNLCDPKTLSAKEISWTPQGKKEVIQIQVKGLVDIFDTELTKEFADNWCMKMVTVFNERFSNPDDRIRFTIYFGGNGKKAGAPVLRSIDSVFFPEDVAQLAFNSYEEAILDGSFFAHDDLV